MADYTQNKKLELPKSNEHYDVGVANKNNMVIDSELHKLDLKNQSQDELLATKQSLLDSLTKLDEEIQRAKSSENVLSDNINTETDRAINAERDIINELDNYLPIDGTAKNSKKLEGYEVTKTSSKIFGAIPRVDDAGVLEIGKYIDFHKNETDFTDFYIRVTAKDDGLYIGNNKILVKGDALSSSGGTIASTTQQMLNLRYTGEKGDAIIQLFPDNSTTKKIALQSAFSTNENNIIFKVFSIEEGSVKQLLELSQRKKNIFDPKTSTMKPIMVKGDAITPTVKETTLKTSTKELTVYGINGATKTDITDIFNKANEQNEGMRLGVSPVNGMGYIQSQNFRLNCSLLTSEERSLLQSFPNIRISVKDNSPDFPRIKPDTFNFLVEMRIDVGDGEKQVFTKMQIISNGTENYFQYDIPVLFRTADFSKGVLKIYTNEWCVAMGIDIKNRG